MRISILPVLAAGTLLGTHLACAQMLIVDRGLPQGSATSSATIGKTTGAGFVGDHFRLGGTGEVWIIDKIRVWGSAGESVRHGVKLGDAFASLALFGGIEAPPPDPTKPPEPECDCHNLMSIKASAFEPGSETPASADLAVTTSADGIWQVDFQNIHWSIPGGLDIQFGVMAKPRGKQIWHTRATHMEQAHALKVFDAKGKLEGAYATGDRMAGLNLQVWAHRFAPVSIRSGSTTIDVVLRSDAQFDAGKVDPTTLHLGPKNALPVKTSNEVIDGHSGLVARFRRSDLGIQGAVVSVCLTGLQYDRVPFEGCDLLSAK